MGIQNSAHLLALKTSGLKLRDKPLELTEGIGIAGIAAPVARTVREAIKGDDA